MKMTEATSNEISRSDHERLQTAEHALALALDELRGLKIDREELAYLADVLRVGVQRAMMRDAPLADLPSFETEGRPH